MNHILFPITWKCNLTCSGCCARKNSHVDIDKCMQHISTMAGKVPWVYITGGEPFLLGNVLFNVCDKLRAYDFKVGITTNGTIFNPEIANHIDRLGISLDGDRSYHDLYRGQGVYDKAVSLFNAVKVQNKCETVIMSTAFRTNQEALLRLKKDLKELNPTYWQIQRDINDTTLQILKELQNQENTLL